MKLYTWLDEGNRIRVSQQKPEGITAEEFGVPDVEDNSSPSLVPIPRVMLAAGEAYCLIEWGVARRWVPETSVGDKGLRRAWSDVIDRQVTFKIERVLKDKFPMTYRGIVL